MSDLLTRRRFLENTSLMAMASTCATAFAQFVVNHLGHFILGNRLSKVSIKKMRR